MPEAEPPEDLPERIVNVLETADLDGPATAGRIQRLLAKDGIDVAARVIRETCGDLAADGRLVERVGPKYGLPDG